MAQYEYELLEEKKKQETNMAVIIAIVLPILFFIAGILWGINQLNTNPEAVTGKLVEGEPCTFCFTADLLPKQNTINQVQVTQAPEQNIKFNSKVDTPKCVDLQELTFTLEVTASAEANVKNILLYTPLSYEPTLIQDKNNGTDYKFTTKDVAGAQTVTVNINKSIKNLALSVTGKFKEAGKYNILPIIELQTGKKYTLSTIPFEVKDSCTQSNNVAATPTPTTQPTVTLTPTTNPTVEAQSTSTPTPAPTTVPNTGVIDTMFYFIVGFIIGMLVLKTKRMTFIPEFFNNAFIRVYSTAGDILARTFGTRVYKEKKILDKLFDKSGKAKANIKNSKSSSPEGGRFA